MPEDATLVWRLLFQGSDTRVRFPSPVPCLGDHLAVAPLSEERGWPVNTAPRPLKFKRRHAKGIGGQFLKLMEWVRVPHDAPVDRFKKA